MSEAKQVELNLSMLQLSPEQFKILFDSLHVENVDVSRLRRWEEDFNAMENLTIMNIETWGMTTGRAVDVATDYLAVATRFADYAKIRLKAIQAETNMVKAPEALKTIGAKDTIDARRSYVEMSPDCVAAEDRYNCWRVLADWFSAKADSFQNKHNWIKKRIDLLVANRG